ncbi:MAG: hypothetical protein JWO52_5526 [Gammaproteobacteria bacterium]|jgi:hypothetical protein|nr:hypothetical protein [Gammaproteobacteria bacterium]
MTEFSLANAYEDVGETPNPITRRVDLCFVWIPGTSPSC